MIPPFDTDGNLPVGVHDATWEEIKQRFGWNGRRRELLGGLRNALENLRFAGCARAYIDGSFVTSLAMPRDYDGCWEPAGVDLLRLDPTLYDFANERRAQKRKYGGELFPASFIADAAGFSFFELFQLVRGTDDRKGIIAIDLEVDL
jgi:hypothetical protein